MAAFHCLLAVYFGTIQNAGFEEPKKPMALPNLLMQYTSLLNYSKILFLTTIFPTVLLYS
jgi:hypothetical protein